MSCERQSVHLWAKREPGPILRVRSSGADVLPPATGLPAFVRGHDLNFSAIPERILQRCRRWPLSGWSLHHTAAEIRSVDAQVCSVDICSLEPPCGRRGARAKLAVAADQ